MALEVNYARRQQLSSDEAALNRIGKHRMPVAQAFLRMRRSQKPLDQSIGASHRMQNAMSNLTP